MKQELTELNTKERQRKFKSRLSACVSQLIWLKLFCAGEVSGRELSSVLLRREHGAVLTLGIGDMKQCPQPHVVISRASQAGDELLIHSNQYWFVVHL